jgi:hypothetical protein
MVEELMRFEREISPDELESALSGTTKVKLERTGSNADLGAVDKAIERLASSPKTVKTQYDIEIVALLHRALKHLPPPVKLDMRFWQWMSIHRFPNLVWRRWGSGPPSDIKSALSQRGLSPRFLGNRSSLRGRHRNALSRLFFAADMLYDKEEGYKLAGSAFTMQDRHTSLFEREMGLVPAAARALIRLTSAMDSKQIQRTAKRLNHIGSTLVFEFMEERELISLLK